MVIPLATPPSRNIRIQMLHKKGKNLFAPSIDSAKLVRRVSHFKLLQDTNRIEFVFTPVPHKLVAKPVCCTSLITQVPTDIVSMKVVH